VSAGGKLKELHKATGGAWGGTMVDEAFRQLLLRLMGSHVITPFYNQHADDYLDIFREFEIKKRAISSETKGAVYLRIPPALSDIFINVMGEKLNESIANSQFANMIKMRGDKLRIDVSLVTGLFNDTVDSIIAHVNELLQKTDVSDISAILMVGGFSDSPMLQDAIRKNFPDLQIIIPKDAGSAVLIGAVIYGHSPSEIAERKCKYTYGVRSATMFIEGVHPESKKYIDRKGDVRSRDCFNIHIREGGTVVVGEAQREVLYVTAANNQQTMTFHIYASTDKDVVLVTDPGCTKLGILVVPIPDPGPGRKTVRMQMIFGGTEIEVEARDENGKVTKGAFDFLG
jgi:hypothetical protein